MSFSEVPLGVNEAETWEFHSDVKWKVVDGATNFGATLYFPSQGMISSSRADGRLAPVGGAFEPFPLFSFEVNFITNARLSAFFFEEEGV